MKALHFVFDKEWKIKLILLLVSFSIYFFYFQNIFLNLNSVLSSITSDTIKNYYTYFYHIKHDSSALHFSGMAYPYGEHVVYTDCQPLLTLILRVLPFTHNYLIGILHALIFLSFIIGPIFLYKSFRLFELNQFTSFFIALGIGLLSPQFLKINAGHHGLAYGAMIPYAIFLLSKYFTYRLNKTLWILLLYQTLLFFIHPYMGFSICIFSLLAFIFLILFDFNKNKNIKTILLQFISCISPIIVFKVFMVLTDNHPNRTNEPYGLNMMIENIDSILAPVFGPMKKVMEVFFNNRVPHYEGHSYLGLITILSSLLFLGLLSLRFKKIKFNSTLVALLFSAFVLLLISFGLHNQICGWLGLDLAFMNQFRATCRFAWFFYYMLPIFLVVTMYHYFLPRIKQQKSKVIFASLPLLFFTSNLWETHYMFKMDEHVFWKFKNIFNETLLNAEEQNVLKSIRSKKIQAIVPLPLFHSGSEMYDRTGFNNSMIPSILYASHTGIPILSALMSRTSMTETKEGINLLNSYKNNRTAVNLLSEDDFLIIKTEKEILPDEERLLNEVNVFHQNDSLEFGFINKADFIKRKLDKHILVLENKNKQSPDSNEVVFIQHENRHPYIETNMKEFTSIYQLDSNKVKGGKYIFSLKYHYTLNNYHALACDVIVTETDKSNFIWKYMFPLRILSGFYDDYAIIEMNIELIKNRKYEFLISGREDRMYHISDFMLRPFGTSVVLKTTVRDSSFNNFPQ